MVLIIIIFISVLNTINYKQKLISVQQQEKILIAQTDTLKTSLKHYRQVLQYQPTTLTNEDIEKLKKKGLQDPTNDIIADLMKHKKLIPYKGVLGGTMGFYYQEGIHALTPTWVFVSFDDGHIAGYMLLKYQVSDEGKISWKVLDSYLL